MKHHEPALATVYPGTVIPEEPPPPDCEKCGDTHEVFAPWLTSTIPCSDCPRPCEECRGDSFRAYCKVAPCPCGCHRGEPVVAERRETVAVANPVAKAKSRRSVEILIRENNRLTDELAGARASADLLAGVVAEQAKQLGTEREAREAVEVALRAALGDKE